MDHFAVSAVGRDRPGIVAAITAVLLELKGNVEDSRMSILRGYFSVMLIVAVPEGVGRDGLADPLAGVRDELGLDALTVSEVSELDDSGPEATHVLSVYGADHPGIVHAVSSELAERGISITDLETKLAGDPDKPLYVMLMEIAAGDAEEGELREALERVGKEAGVEVSLRELGAEAL